MKHLRLVREPFEDYRAVIYRSRDKILAKPQTIFSHIKRLNKYYQLQQLQQIENFAHRNGMVVVPATILNWRRRQKFASREYVCGKDKYYLVPIEELKAQELYDLEKIADVE